MKATKDPSSDKGASLPKDAAEFVKKMGIDTNGLEVEVYSLKLTILYRLSFKRLNCFEDERYMENVE